MSRGNLDNKLGKYLDKKLDICYYLNMFARKHFSEFPCPTVMLNTCSRYWKQGGKKGRKSMTLHMIAWLVFVVVLAAMALVLCEI